MVGRIVIPARLASTRLPEKLLLSETGMSVLEHTYRASRLSQKTAGTIVAVDHPRLFQLVQSFPDSSSQGMVGEFAHRRAAFVFAAYWNLRISS